MFLRRGVGALFLGLVLAMPVAAFGQGAPRNDPNALKHHAAPPTTAPRSTIPVMPPALIVPRDRAVIQNYYRSQAKAGHCPPGQAKKGNCEPALHAQERNTAAMAPPPPGTNMTIQPLPRSLLERLTLAPSGYAYGYSNGSVVLYSTSNRTISDSAPAY